MRKTLLLFCATLFLFTGCSSENTKNTDTSTESKNSNTEKTTEAKTEKATVAAKEDQTVYWINGTCAIVTELNGLDLKYFGGVKDQKAYAQAMQETLKSAWGIENKEDLLAMVESLKKNQRHNRKFLEELAELGCDTTMSVEEFQSWMANEDYDEDMINYMSAGYMAYKEYGDNAIFAWDLSRATQLLGQGYLVGYIEYAEALDLALEISKDIQSTFDSWDSYWDSYMMGYVYWSEDLMTDSSSSYAKRVKILDKLKAAKDSPLQLDWNLELNKSW